MPAHETTTISPPIAQHTGPLRGRQMQTLPRHVGPIPKADVGLTGRHVRFVPMSGIAKVELPILRGLTS
jgi:hypothetical protein